MSRECSLNSFGMHPSENDYNIYSHPLDVCIAKTTTNESQHLRQCHWEFPTVKNVWFVISTVTSDIIFYTDKYQ